MIASVFSIGFVAVLISLMIWTRSRRRRSVGMVEVFRLSLISVAVLLLFRPESTRTVDSEEPIDLVLIVDESRSMSTPDVITAQGSVERNELVTSMLADPAWDGLSQRFELTRMTADGDDLAAEITTALQSVPQATTVVLLSDGDVKSLSEPRRSIGNWMAGHSARATLHTVAAGRSSPLPDIELTSVVVPSVASPNKSLQIPFRIENRMPSASSLLVSALIDGEIVQRRAFDAVEPGSFSDSFTVAFDRLGTQDFCIRVEPVDGEWTVENNEVIERVNVRKEQLRVLIIESRPRWEFRFLRNALLRDPGVEVSCLLFHPTLGVVGEGGEDYLAQFPAENAELDAFDVVFLGDVGVGDHGLTLKQCRRLATLIEQQASGLVMMPGPRGGQASLRDTPLERLFPVVIDYDRPRGHGSSQTAQMTLTQSGRTSLLMQLVDDPTENWRTWERLPGFNWHAGLIRAKSGSEVLAVHDQARNDYGRYPLVVTRPAGNGKVLFMGTDAAWRWRLGVEDRYHYRYWGQMIRWMAYQRNLASDQRMRITYTPEKVETGDTVLLRASIMNPNGSPSQRSFVDIEIEAPSGVFTSLRAEKSNEAWGTFQGEFGPIMEPGMYEVRMRHPAVPESMLTTSLNVRGRAGDIAGRPAKPQVMRDIAAMGRGICVEDQQGVATLVAKLNEQVRDDRRIIRFPWWHHPTILLGMIAGLSGFWCARRWAGGI